MTTDFDDLAGSERQALIASVQAEGQVNWEQTALSLADDLLDTREACMMAIHWLNQHAPGRAIDELLRVVRNGGVK